MKNKFTEEFGRVPDLWPEIIGLDHEVYELFPVPVENAVGTNSIDCSISLLKFEEDKISYHKILSHYSGACSGGTYSFCPVFDNEWIAFGLTRGFSLLNVKTHQFVDHIPYPQIENSISAFCSVPNQKNTFLIQIEHGNIPYDDRMLQIVNFDMKGKYSVLAELVQTGRHVGTRGEPLILRDNRLFGFHDCKFEVFDLMTLKPSTHPLISFLNSVKSDRIDYCRICALAIHPELPFAILQELRHEGSDYNSREWLIMWEKTDADKSIVDLTGKRLLNVTANNKMMLADFQFSPDGRWMVLKDYYDSGENENPYYIAVPIDKNSENYIGRPKMLGKLLKKDARPYSDTWISKPLSFVVTDGDVIYKWELDKLKREF